jgi:glycosyltransferase involved in cell wall biosynthesis
MPKPKAALLEIYDSHDVNLYSQLQFLKNGGFETTFIVSEAHRKQVSDFQHEQETIYVHVTKKKGIDQWKELWRIRTMILERGITHVIFNTAHSNPVRNFCLLPFPKEVRFFGTLHGVNKLEGSLTQRIISRKIHNYYLLMDYMLEKAMKMPHAGLNFAVFYPIFHPPFAPAAIAEKKENEIWIAIPGAVEYKRRDYLSLLEPFAALENKPDVRFLLLGNGYHKHGNGQELQERIKSLGIENYFVFFDGFVPNEVLHAYVKACDAVMPLIHPINADMEKYLENQISGSFHLAFAYKKPLLLHKYYERYQDFRETGIFYDLEGLTEFLDRLPKKLYAFGPDRYDNPKWTMEYQSEQYCSLFNHPVT